MDNAQQNMEPAAPSFIKAAAEQCVMLEERLAEIHSALDRIILSSVVKAEVANKPSPPMPSPPHEIPTLVEEHARLITRLTKIQRRTDEVFIRLKEFV